MYNLSSSSCLFFFHFDFRLRTKRLPTFAQWHYSIKRATLCRAIRKRSSSLTSKLNKVQQIKRYFICVYIFLNEFIQLDRRLTASSARKYGILYGVFNAIYPFSEAVVFFIASVMIENNLYGLNFQSLFYAFFAVLFRAQCLCI